MNSYYKRIKRYKKELHLDDNPQGFLCDDEDRAIINVGAENYDDVFSPYCFKGGDTLPLELVSYLNQKANTIPLDYDLVIRFHVKQASEEKRREIKAAVRENYKNDIRSIDRKMNRTFVFTLWFLLIGAVFTTLYLLTQQYVPVAVSYILDLLAWIFLWEGVDAFFLDRRKMKLDRLKAYRLSCAKIEIIEFEPY